MSGKVFCKDCKWGRLSSIDVVKCTCPDWIAAEGNEDEDMKAWGDKSLIKDVWGRDYNGENDCEFFSDRREVDAFGLVKKDTLWIRFKRWLYE